MRKYDAERQIFGLVIHNYFPFIIVFLKVLAFLFYQQRITEKNLIFPMTTASFICITAIFIISFY